MIESFKHLEEVGAGRDLADQAQRYAEEWLRDCTYNPASANG